MKLENLLPIAAGLAAALVAASAIASAAPDFTAVVNADGSLARGLKATAAVHLGTGEYEVDFTKNVTACGYTASIGLSGSSGSSDPGTVNVVGKQHNAKALFIQTFDATATPADLGFHVIVSC